MSDQDPRRLKSAGETPAELVSALRALGQADRDAARLARVGERLGEQLAQGAPGPTASWLKKLTGTKTGLTSLVVGFGVLGALGYALIAERGAELPEAPPSATPAPTTAPAPAPAPAPATQPVPVVEPALAPSSKPAPVPHAARRSGADARRAARADMPSTATDASGVKTPVEPAAASTTPEPTPEPEPKPESEPEQPRPEKPATADQAVTARPSEVALLQQARKVAVQKPAAAMRLLDEHTQRFPDGTLRPEREVLAIEVLRRLGRTAEAAQRLRQFEARYPQSIHLRRLQHPEDP